MTGNEKQLLSILTIQPLYHKYAPYVKNYFSSPDGKKLWLRLCKMHEKGVEPRFPELLDSPPKGADAVAEDLVSRFIITQEVQSRVEKLNSPDLLSLDGTGAHARENYKQRRISKVEETQKCDASTGIPKLDSLIEGFYRKELNLIAALGGGGKTHWLVYFASQAIKKKMKIVHIFIEDTPKRMAQYYRQAGVKLDDLMLLDYSDAPPTLPEIEEIGKAENPDIFVVDYADLLEDSGSTDIERFKIKELYQGLRNIANKTNCIMLTASQTDASGTGLAEAKVIKRAICDVIIYYKDNYFNIDKARGRYLKENSLFVVPDWDKFTVKERKGI